jgi:predicted transglutaminase-like cysteine proteinase
MKHTWLKWNVVPVAILFAGAMAGTQAMAQSQSTTSTTQASSSDPATIGQRKDNQQDRIAQGVMSGELTPGETTKLEDKEAGLNHEVSADRAADGGKLTQAEKTQINGQQNKLSNQIYSDKHNANTDHFGNSEVGQRQENQQDRIAQGIKSGQLTPGEAGKLEGKETAVNQQVRADRQENGGKLTQGEKKQVNNEQNHLSKNIYSAKHNGRRGK